MELIPHERRVVDYEERRVVDQVPVEKTIMDYCVVEHVVEYQPQVVEDKVVEMVPVERTVNRTTYTPVEQ